MQGSCENTTEINMESSNQDGVYETLVNIKRLLNLAPESVTGPEIERLIRPIIDDLLTLAE